MFARTQVTSTSPSSPSKSFLLPPAATTNRRIHKRNSLSTSTPQPPHQKQPKRKEQDYEVRTAWFWFEGGVSSEYRHPWDAVTGVRVEKHVQSRTCSGVRAVLLVLIHGRRIRMVGNGCFFLFLSASLAVGRLYPPHILHTALTCSTGCVELLINLSKRGEKDGHFMHSSDASFQ